MNKFLKILSAVIIVAAMLALSGPLFIREILDGIPGARNIIFLAGMLVFVFWFFDWLKRERTPTVSKKDYDRLRKLMSEILLPVNLGNVNYETFLNSHMLDGDELIQKGMQYIADRRTGLAGLYSSSTAFREHCTNKGYFYDTHALPEAFSRLTDENSGYKRMIAERNAANHERDLLASQVTKFLAELKKMAPAMASQFNQMIELAKAAADSRVAAVDTVAVENARLKGEIAGRDAHAEQERQRMILLPPPASTSRNQGRGNQPPTTT